MIVIYNAMTGSVSHVLPGFIATKEGNTLWADNGNRVVLGDGMKAAMVIEQPIHQLMRYDDDGNATIEAKYPDDFTPLGKDDVSALIDRDTGKAIDETVHPFAGLEEQIGILRAQIAEILVALGLEPTDEFAKLNAIAAEKIQEARKKKEIIDAKDS